MHLSDITPEMNRINDRIQELTGKKITTQLKYELNLVSPKLYRSTIKTIDIEARELQEIVEDMYSTLLTADLLESINIGSPCIIGRN